MIPNDNLNLLQPFQIIYASLATRELPSAEVRELLDIARKNNASVHVGGMLVYHEGCFLQVLEGPRVAVEGIFMRVKTDPRHTNVKLLLRCGIQDNQFADWAMAYVDTDGRNEGIEGYIDYLDKLEKEIDGEGQALKVLRQFKQGSWRDIVQDDNFQAAV
jgi:hypothetical protein